MAYEWDPEKNAENIKKHGIHFADAVPVLEDDYAITITDTESDPNEEERAFRHTRRDHSVS